MFRMKGFDQKGCLRQGYLLFPLVEGVKLVGVAEQHRPSHPHLTGGQL